ncbi:MAG: hypothetical protein B0D96_03915, partial [Candidatus Sedimenticola endophacoides]
MDNKLANNGNGKVTSIRAPLIKECMTLTLRTLDQHLATMFDEVEPAYLDFAEMAETNQSQLRFVDAINLIKGQRDQIERAFEEQISRGFLEFRDGKSITYPAHISLPHPEGHLSIVDNDDLEKHVAIQKMVGRLHSESFQEIYALGQRMAMLRGGQKLREEDMPGSPIHIATCFDIASGKLQLDSKMLLILLLLFDRFVMRQCTGIYRQLNERLVRAGIFPNLRYETPEPGRDPTSAPSRERNPAGAIRREQATHGHPEPGGGSAPAPYTPGQTVSAGTTGSTLVNHPAATANGTPAAERSTAESANHPGDSHARPGQSYAPGTIGNPQTTPNWRGGRRPEVEAIGKEIFSEIISLLKAQHMANPRYSEHPDLSDNAAPREMARSEAIISTLQECRYLVKDFGTSQSPKSTRQRDSRYCPDRPALITTPSRTLQQSCSCA